MSTVRTRIVAGVRFVAGGDGHYYSEDGRYAIFHMLRDTEESCWELYAKDGDNVFGKLIDDAMTLGEIVQHGENGRYQLAGEQP
jgi:hypothetical protein